jgi:hypothetical protein
MFAVLKRVPSQVPPPAPVGPHWTVRIRRIAQKSGVMPPPEPPAKSVDVHGYWNEATVDFPIEKMQKRTTSVLHCLLSSFVELDDTDRPERSECPLFVTAHPLIPEIPCDGYVGVPFETRLGLELESLGLNTPAPEKLAITMPFQRDIVDYVRDVNEFTLPELLKLEPDIRSIGKFREKEKKMIARIEETKRRLAELKRKKPAKK